MAANRRKDPKGRYKDRVKGQTEEAFGIENVPGFERPMAAGPKDIPIGKDELGRTIYRTVLGTTYTIDEKPDQRTTRKKVQDWWDSGAPLPSKEQVIETAKAIPGAMLDSAEATLAGEASLGEAMGVAPGMQAPGLAARVPAGALRMGGGRNTENPKYNPLVLQTTKKPLTQEQFDEAKRLQEIWADLGVIDDDPAVDALEEAAKKLGRDPEEFRDDIWNNFEGDDPQTGFAEWVKRNYDENTSEAFSDIWSGIKTIEDLNKYRLDWLNTGGSQIDFYNPLRNSLENLDFGKKGLRGETIAAHLEKRTPKARKSLLRSVDSGRGIFEPNKRYTQEEALGIIDKNFGRVYVEADDRWDVTQRMSFLENEEKDYGEIVIRQKRDVPFKAKGDQHYSDDAIAHARFSIRDDGAGGDMLVVEELQSDLVQKGFDTDVFGRDEVKYHQVFSTPEFTEKYPKSLLSAAMLKDKESFIRDELLGTLYQLKQDYNSDFNKSYPDFVASIPTSISNFDLYDHVTTYPRHVAPDDWESLWMEAHPKVKGKKPPVSLPPVETTTDFVRPLIHSLMREAKNRGVDKIVIPNSDAFIEARKNQLGNTPEEIESAKKAFQNTYDRAVDKVLRELDREQGVDVTIDKMNLKGRVPDSFENELYHTAQIDVPTFSQMSEEDYVNLFSDEIARNLVKEERIRKDYNRFRDIFSAKDRKYPSRMITINSLPEGKLRFASGGLVQRRPNTKPSKPEAVFSDQETLQGKVDTQNFADQLDTQFGEQSQWDRLDETRENLLATVSPDVIKQVAKGALNLSDQEADEVSKLDPKVLKDLLRDTSFMVNGLSQDTTDSILLRYKIGSDHYVDYKNRNPKVEMAKGGLVEDQIKFAFMEGGMVDDGKEVEATTGNEIPPGSLDQEVADTVDAKLSEGEFVIPADVVQYFGVDKFRKMIAQAKKGLAEMEAEGQIGGEMSEDELPFSDEELVSEDGAEGTPGFAEGGMVQGVPNPATQGPAFETITYVGPDGSEFPILFMNGQPVQQIPQGYVRKDQAKASGTFKSSRAAVQPNNGGDDDRQTDQLAQGKPVSEWQVEDFEKYANSQAMMDIVTKLPGAMGPFGALAGSAVNKLYDYQGRQAMEEIDRRLETEIDEASRQRLEQAKAQISANQEKEGGLFGEEGLLGTIASGGNPFDKVAEAFGLKKPSIQTTAQPSSSQPRSTPQSTSTGNEPSPQAPTSSPRPQPREVTVNDDGTRTVDTAGGSYTTTSTQGGSSNPGGFDEEKESWGVGPMAKGGLVKRRKK